MRSSHRKPSLLGILLCAFVILGSYGIVFAEQELLTNPGFELPITEQLPPGWQKFSNTDVTALLFGPESATNPSIIFTINDLSSTIGYGLRSMYFPAEPGQVYTASVKAKAIAGGIPTLYIDYTNEKGTRVASKTVTTNSTEWTPISITLEAPAGTVNVSIILYSQTVHAAPVMFDDASLVLVSGN
jgi:hypothetical protein